MRRTFEPLDLVSLQSQLSTSTHTTMDGQKPNYRPKKQKTHYGTQLAKREHEDTIVVASSRDGPTHVHARGEEFAAQVNYSLNKARRWELSERDFETSEADQKVVVARGTFGYKEDELDRKHAAFQRQYANGPVDSDSDEEPSRTTRTTKKDRKHYTTKPTKKNHRMANSHSAETYKIAEADVLVSIKESTPTTEKAKPFSEVSWDYDKKHGMPRQVRAHKYSGIEV